MPLPSPTADKDVQEALSRRYTNAHVVILPLASGHFAIFDRRWTLHAIADGVPQAHELRAWSDKFYEAITASDKPFYPGAAGPLMSADALEI